MQDIGKSTLSILAAEDGYQETAMDMDGGTLEVVPRQPTTTAVDDLLRVYYAGLRRVQQKTYANWQGDSDSLG